MKLMSIAGARPNFMKLASIADAVKDFNTQQTSNEKIEHIIVHTGQHYDTRMSDGFFSELGIPEPDINLEVGSGSHATQTADIMKRFEKVLLAEQPEVLLVVGDVNSTIACTLVASKIEYSQDCSLSRPVIVHVEAGLRSFDRTMPEEINRILTDALSDLLFITEQSGVDNLTKEGVEAEKIYLVGNVMIDTLQRHLKTAANSQIRQDFPFSGSFILATLHRPSNVDNAEELKMLMDCFVEISKEQAIIFPLHPRTENNLKKFGLFDILEDANNIYLAPPLGYLDFLNLISHATMVLTDSGGIQEETTYLKVPCVTLRDNTERPVTVSVGSNYLIGTDTDRILETVSELLNGHGKKSQIPVLWDGRAGERIIQKIAQRVMYN